MTTIKRIHVKNIKAVDDMSIELNGATAIVTGGNNKGKSTLLRSVIERIRGEKPELILKDLQKAGLGEIELMDGSQFVWDIKNNDSDSITYITPEGFKVKASVDIRNKYFPPVFDIDKFLNSTPKQQLEQIKKLTGLNLDEIEEEYSKAFESRTIANRLEDDTKARVMNVDESLPEQEQDTDGIVSEIATIDSHNRVYAEVSQKLESKKSQVGIIERQIQQLQAQLEQVKDDIVKGEAWVADSKNQPKDNKAELQDQLATAKELNEKIRANNKAKQTVMDYEQAKGKAEQEDATVKEIQQRMKDMISQANLPEGFDIENGKLLYQGYPLDRNQQSSSRLYIASLMLAKELIGEVQALPFDASFLDKNSLQEIFDWANKQGLQLLIERPDYDGGEIKYEFITLP